MTTVSRTQQVSHSSVTSGSGGFTGTGGGGGGDWDHRLNNLLHDLQESVIPEESRRGGAEYREYRLTTSSKHNDEPPSNTEEKWIEYGAKNGQGYERSRPMTPTIMDSGFRNTASTSSSKFESSSEKTVGFSSDSKGGGGTRSYGIDPGLTSGRQIEYLSPVNTTTILKSSSPSPGGIEPKVDRKEFYAKAQYTTLLKGGPGGDYVPESRDRIMEDLLPPRDFPPFQQQQQALSSPRPTVGAITSSTSTSESRREFEESRRTGGGTGGSGYRCPAADLLARQQQTDIHTSSSGAKTSHLSQSYSKEMKTTTGQAIMEPAPKPIEGLKTPPIVRKVLHQSTASYDKSYDSSRVGSTPIPVQTYGDGQTQYYTSRTTRTETRERDMSPVRRFPSPVPPRREYEPYAEPPKHLDQLLATFDESYTHTSRITGDGGGAHKSHPYGPGTHQMRNVRYDEKVQSRSVIDSDTELVQRKTGNGAVEKSYNVSGPPVFYPPGQMFKAEEEEYGKGKAKAKMERQYKAKESSKQKHSEKGGGGAVPVPVCLPVCCAAPCVIQ